MVFPFSRCPSLLLVKPRRGCRSNMPPKNRYRRSVATLAPARFRVKRCKHDSKQSETFSMYARNKVSLLRARKLAPRLCSYSLHTVGTDSVKAGSKEWSAAARVSSSYKQEYSGSTLPYKVSLQKTSTTAQHHDRLLLVLIRPRSLELQMSLQSSRGWVPPGMDEPNEGRNNMANKSSIRKKSACDSYARPEHVTRMPLRAYALPRISSCAVLLSGV
jgi:hypothetical protein